MLNSVQRSYSSVNLRNTKNVSFTSKNKAIIAAFELINPLASKPDANIVKSGITTFSKQAVNNIRLLVAMFADKELRTGYLLNKETRLIMWGEENAPLGVILNIGTARFQKMAKLKLFGKDEIKHIVDKIKKVVTEVTSN